MSAVSTAECTPSIEPVEFDNVISEHVSTYVLQLQQQKFGAHVPSSVSTVPRLQPVLAAAAAVVQFADINEGKFSHDYQSAMSLLLIDFTFLKGRDGEPVFKELAVVDSHSNRVQPYVFKRPYCWEDLPALSARINHVVDHGFNWKVGNVLYSEMETVLHREASSAVAVYCFGPQKTQFICGLMDRTVIDITQLGCPP